MKTIIWDLDGTIADTEMLHFHVWQQILPGYGVEQYDIEMFRSSFGQNNVEILRKLFPAVPLAMIHGISEVKESVFCDRVSRDTVQMLPGVADWLAYFRSLHVNQVIGSSGPMNVIASIVTALDVSHYFLALLSGYGIPRGKPDPMLFLNCAAAVAADPSECVVIEDSVHGVEAAHAAGMPCVVVGKLAGDARIRPYLAPGRPACLLAPSLSAVDPAAALALLQ